MLRKIFNLLELIKFSHTIFALPFALISMLVAARGFPAWSVFGWIMVCMVGARTAAMGFNRYLDWEIDRQNPRTQIRSQLATRKGALVLTWLGGLTFLFGVLNLNSLCLGLSPVALIFVLGYSWMKRFTVWCHLGLGLALSIAPLGAWAAVTGSLEEFTPWVLSFAVLCWVFGFDLIYATQDIECDQIAGLHSIPAKYGIPKTLTFARVAHLLTFLALGSFGLLASLGLPYWSAWGAVAIALVYEHYLCRETADLVKINRAFFFVNGLIGIILFAGVAFSIL